MLLQPKLILCEVVFPPPCALFFGRSLHHEALVEVVLMCMHGYVCFEHFSEQKAHLRVIEVRVILRVQHLTLFHAPLDLFRSQALLIIVRNHARIVGLFYLEGHRQLFLFLFFSHFIKKDLT